MISLKGILPDKAVQALDQLATRVDGIHGSVTALQAKQLISKPEADAAYGPAVQAKALQVSGSNPLNLTGLIGLQTGVKAGTYAIGSITSITVNANGQITNIT